MGLDTTKAKVMRSFDVLTIRNQLKSISQFKPASTLGDQNWFMQKTSMCACSLVPIGPDSDGSMAQELWGNFGIKLCCLLTVDNLFTKLNKIFGYSNKNLEISLIFGYYQVLKNLPGMSSYISLTNRRNRENNRTKQNKNTLLLQVQVDIRAKLQLIRNNIIFCHCRVLCKVSLLNKSNRQPWIAVCKE